MGAQASRAMAALRAAGLKPPWVHACLDYGSHRVVVCLSDEVVSGIGQKKPATGRPAPAKTPP